MSALVIALVLLAALAVAIGWLRPGSTAPIVDARGKPVPGSIAVLEKVKLGGVAQSLLIPRTTSKGARPNGKPGDPPFR